MRKRSVLVPLVSVLFLIMAASFTMAEISTEKPKPAQMKRAIFKIKSLSCWGCYSTINSGLQPLEGYSGMGANLMRKLIAVDFIPPLTPDVLAQNLSELGYPAELEDVETILKKNSFKYRKSGQGCAVSGSSQSGSCCGTDPQARKSITGQKPMKTEPAPLAGGACCSKVPPASDKPTTELSL